jgi:hypothetical protein
MGPRAVRSLLLALGALLAVWSASAIVTGLYYVVQGKYVNGVMFGALVVGVGLFVGIARDRCVGTGRRREARERPEATESSAGPVLRNDP